MTRDIDAHALFQSITVEFIECEGVGLDKMVKAEALQVGGKSFAYSVRVWTEFLLVGAMYAENFGSSASHSGQS